MSDCFERSFGTHTLRCFPYFISRITSQEDLERTARVFFETADRLNVDPLEATMIFQSYKMLMPEGSDLAFDVIDSIRRPLDMYHAAALDKKVPGQKMGCQSYIKSRDTNILRPPGASNASATCAACPFSKTRYKNAFAAAEYKLGTNFVISVPFETMTDNEHTVTIYAVDINGVKGEEVTRTFRISLHL